MASGTPCVATAEGGIPEMVTHGVNGYVVRQHEFDKMVEFIKELINNDESRNKFGKAARKATVKDWDWDLVTTKYERLYEEVINEPRNSPIRPD